MPRTLYHNGLLLTQNLHQPTATAFSVVEGRIEAIGTMEELMALEVDERVDLQGRTVLPGFIDAHIHVWKVGNLRTYTLDVRGLTRLSEILAHIKAYAEANPGLAWVQARGFNEAILEEGRMPTRADLDAILPDRPVFLLRTCAHIAVFNSKALALAGLTPETPVPAGGEVQVDENGELNGIVCETALGLVTKAIPLFSDAQYSDMIHAAAKELLRLGVTSATDPGVLPDLLATYRRMDAERVLPMRFNVMAIRLPDGGNQALSLPETYLSEWLRIDTIKFFSDGGLSGKTSAVSRPYRGFSDTGILRFTEERLYDLAVEAHQRGLRIATHAIGDMAIETVLKVYERLYTETASPQKHRIEHFGLPTDAHIETMVRLGLSAVPQPIFLEELGPNFRKYLDDGYLARCYPVRTLLDAGMTVAFSTDAPVVKAMNPFIGIQAAVTRMDRLGVQISASEAISTEEALYAYTMGAATANGNAHEVGSLEAGKFADFIILDQNPLEMEPSALQEVCVLATYLAGNCVFEKMG